MCIGTSYQSFEAVGATTCKATELGISEYNEALWFATENGID